VSIDSLPSTDHQAPPFSLAWSYPTHCRIAGLDSAPGIIVSAKDTQVVALEAATGDERWKQRNMNTQWNQLVTTHSQAFLLGGFSHLSAINLDDGCLQWRQKVPSYTGWVHAAHKTVIAGGWRGYTPIHAFDADTGHMRWRRPLDMVPVRTALYEPLAALAVVFPDGRILLLALEDGEQIGEVILPVSLSGADFIPSGNVGTLGRPLLMQGREDTLYSIEGEGLTVATQHLECLTFTKTFVAQNGEVFFQDRQGQLCVATLGQEGMAVLGPLKHNRSDLFPVMRLPDATVVAGTSFGQLQRYAPQGGLIGSMTLGKRIETPLHLIGEHLCFGTRSGNVTAMHWNTYERTTNSGAHLHRDQQKPST